ncbi:MAG: hypothetical protein CL916_13865 [Deltaproteobacteria bacterium]|nr:hypothetical protein [Deltaproteobacteria bacterium]
MISFFLYGCLVQTQEITWSGNVYGLFTTQLETFSQASLEILSQEGESLTLAQTPYTENLSYQEFTLDTNLLSQDVQIRISGPDIYPTQYFGTTPQNSAIWLNGSIYGYGIIWTESFFQSLGIDILSPSTEEVVQLIGRPSNPEDWGNVEISVIQEDGTAKSAQRYRYDETGFLLSIEPQEETESIDIFVCTDIVPGALTLIAEHSDGRFMEVAYHAQGGSIINAAHLLFSFEE